MSWYRRSIGRHFTWASGAIVALLILCILLLLYVFVPAATGNGIFDRFVGFGIVVSTIIGGISSFIEIYGRVKSTEGDQGIVAETQPSQQDSSTPADNFVQSDEDLMERAMEHFEEAFLIRENGQIILQADGLLLDRRGILYLFAAWVADYAEKRSSPRVSKQELIDELGFTEKSSEVFISKMGPFVSRHYDTEGSRMIGELDADAEIEINPAVITEIVKYIDGERDSPY